MVTPGDWTPLVLHGAATQPEEQLLWDQGPERQINCLHPKLLFFGHAVGHALGAQNLNHGTAREVSNCLPLKLEFTHGH